jgi:hypothetical protein
MGWWTVKWLRLHWNVGECTTSDGLRKVLKIGKLGKKTYKRMKIFDF